MAAFRSWLFGLLLACISLTPVSGTKQTLGDLFETNNAKDTDGAGVFMFDYIKFLEHAVLEFSAYCVRPTPFWFQIWRPIDETALRYKLVYQVQRVPNEVPREYKVRLNTRDQIFFTQPGDRLAIYSESDTNAVAYQMYFGSDRPLYRYSVSSKDDLKIGTEAAFLDIPFPYKFSVSVTFDNDTALYTGPGTGTLIPPTVPPTTRITIPDIPVNEGTIVYSGNSLRSREGALTENARGLYLFHHIKFRKGVIIEFYGYFVRKEYVTFQVFRPIQGNENQFMLVGQASFEPYRVPRIEKFALDQTNYIFTEDNDMLGIMVTNNTCAIGYEFNPDPSKPQPFGAQLDVSDVPYPGYNVTFSPFGLPYDMALGARYDTNPDPAMYGTPKPIVLTTTTTTTTTIATTTLPRVFPDNMVGKDNIRYTSRFLQNGARKTFLLWDLKFPQTGRVTSFWAYVVNTGKMQFQVWRKTSESSENFVLIGTKSFDSTVTSSYTEIPLSTDEQFEVERGDCLGFSNDDDVSVLGYHFETVNLYYSERLTTTTGGVMTFDQLPFPRNFAMGAVFTPITRTTTTPTTTTATATTTTTTDAPVKTKSTTTPTTTPTATPTASPTTSPTASPTTSPTTSATTRAVNRPPGVPASAVSYGWLTEPNFLLGMFIWLVVLSLLFLILCFAMLCRKRRSDNAVYRNNIHGFANPAASSRANSFNNKWGNMKNDETIDYFNPSIGTARSSHDAVGVQRSVSGTGALSGKPQIRPVSSDEESGSNAA